MADKTAELLAIVSTLPPLLLPDLPSPPPSPLRQDHHSRASSNGHSRLKRDLESNLESEYASDSKRPRNESSASVPPRPAPPPPPPSIDLKPPTPEFRHSKLPLPPPPAPPPLTSTSMKASPRLNSNNSLSGTGEPEWKKDWPKERLRKLGAQCRDHGRRLKHSGDSLARRSSAPQTILLSLAHQLDAILLYIFSFWCDDTASKTCINTNWSSVFGLIGFVKKAAEKENQNFVIGICLRMEAIAIYTLSMHEQKALFYKATQLSSSSSHSTTSTSASSSSSSSHRPVPPGPPPPRPPPPPAPAPASSHIDHPSPASSSSTSMTAASPSAAHSQSLSHPSPSQTFPSLPPGPPPPPPPPPPASTSISSSGNGTTTTKDNHKESTTSNSISNRTPLSLSEEFLKQFLRASPELFRFQKLYDESCNFLSSFIASNSRRKTMEISHSDLLLPNPSSSTAEAEGDEEEGELQGNNSSSDEIGLPIELCRGTGSSLALMMIPSQVYWCRCLVQNWSKGIGLDFQFVKIGL